MLFIKVTFFIMYLDIFRLMRWLRACTYIGGIVTVVFYTAMTVCMFVFATPGPSSSWLEWFESSRYNMLLWFLVPQSCIGLAIDIYILILPIIGVSKLQIPLRQKVGVNLVFMSGILYSLPAHGVVFLANNWFLALA